MKIFFKKFFSIILIMLLLSNMLAIPAFAAHKCKGVMCGKQLTWYEDINGTTHTLVTAFEDLCSCGKVLGNIDHSYKVENHEFNGNRCTKCDYTKKHEHKGAMCGKQVTWYESITSTTHTYVTANEELCSCGEYLRLIDVVRTTYNHSFSGDTCKDCNYTREHVHKGAMCGDRLEYYENITSTSHTKVIADEELCSCGEYLDLMIVAEITSSHDFDIDTCEDCGYTREHVHKGVACGDFVEFYENYDEDFHVYVTAFDELCYCGEKLGLTDRTEYIYPHSFVDDICTDCGYLREHKHEGAMCGDFLEYYEKMTPTTHTYVTAYEELCSCGYFIDVMDKTEETSPHNFYGDICTDCGYERNHEHQGAACGDFVESYEDITSETHTYITSYEELCNCGAVIGFVDETKMIEAHSFENNVCIGCGFYNDEHIHKASQCSNGFTFYINPTEETHTRVVYEGDYLCSCGEFVSNGEYEEFIEPHKFENGFCIYCDSDGHVHVAVKNAKPGEYFVYADESKHAKFQVSSGGYCECGEFVPEDNESVTFTYEAHYFSNEKCTKCGYSTKSYGDNAIEQIVLGEFSDESNTAGVVGQIIVGEIPGVGTVADVRDLLASESAGEFMLNAIALLPGGGLVKYSDEVYTVIKHSDDIIDISKNSDELYEAAKMVIRGSDSFDDVTDSMRRISRASDSTEDSYKNFKAFKKAHGKAGEGYEWHHLVEQSQIKKSGFDAEMVQNGNNMIPIDEATHRKISGYYSRKVPGTDMSFRNWLAYKGFSFEEQQKIGIYVLEIYGIKVE